MAAGNCADCGKPVVRTRGSRADIVCHDCRREAREERERNTYCDGCSKLLTARQVRNGARFCGVVCAQLTLGARGAALPRGRDLRANQRKCAMRRARLKTTEVDYVDPTRIFERDRWTCGICHLPVDSGLSGIDQAGPTLDHVVPLSEGGPHTAANLRLAHRRCNSLRGARGGGEQLAIVG